MADFERKSDGRRIFTTEFKRQMVERIRSGEATAAALTPRLRAASRWDRRSSRFNRKISRVFRMDSLSVAIPPPWEGE